jgi:hypothetical protein
MRRRESSSFRPSGSSKPLKPDNAGGRRKRVAKIERAT